MASRSKNGSCVLRAVLIISCTSDGSGERSAACAGGGIAMGEGLRRPLGRSRAAAVASARGPALGLGERVMCSRAGAWAALQEGRVVVARSRRRGGTVVTKACVRVLLSPATSTRRSSRRAGRCAAAVAACAAAAAAVIVLLLLRRIGVGLPVFRRCEWM